MLDNYAPQTPCGYALKTLLGKVDLHFHYQISLSYKYDTLLTLFEQAVPPCYIHQYLPGLQEKQRPTQDNKFSHS